MVETNINIDKDKEIEIKDKRFSKRKRSLSRVKRRVLRHVWLVRLGIIVGIVFLLFLILLGVFNLLKKTKAGYYLNLASIFITTPSGKIEVIGGRTNILLLGKGGEGHEAPDLTDTIIFVSFDHNKKTIDMISLPRDIWVSELRTKLNSTYYWGNEKQPPAQGPSGRSLTRRVGGGGIVLAKSEVEKVIGQPVNYGVVIDFSGFKEIIDVLGGVEVEVENSFVDEKYPIARREDDECDGDPEYKCRYETIEFRKGKQIMDGETALKFVRSRNAEGDEGTDFARSARQQKVISAIKDKVFSREILLSYKKLIELWDTLLKYTETDIDIEAALILARRALQSKDNVSSHVLPEEFLEVPPKLPQYDYLYVFIPVNEDPSTSSGQAWDQVHEWVEGVLVME